jgi:DNA-binding MarR family transcriptional regulator
LRLTAEGESTLARLRGVAEAHEAEVTRGLNDRQKSELAALLTLMLAETELDADVHPGFKDAPV